MGYGELTLPPQWDGRNKKTGRFLKGHIPANKGKKWSEFMSKRSQKRSAKGWKNLDLYRNKNGRVDTAGRCRKQVIAVADDGRWFHFGYLGSAAEWLRNIVGIACNRENIGRCCRLNQSKAILRDTHGRPTRKANTDHRYRGFRFYFESDNAWTTKIKK